MKLCFLQCFLIIYQNKSKYLLFQYFPWAVFSFLPTHIWIIQWHFIIYYYSFLLKTKHAYCEDSGFVYLGLSFPSVSNTFALLSTFFTSFNKSNPIFYTKSSDFSGGGEKSWKEKRNPGEMEWPPNPGIALLPNPCHQALQQANLCHRPSPRGLSHHYHHNRNNSTSGVLVSAGLRVYDSVHSPDSPSGRYSRGLR